ncbi:serine/threonine-protein kinase [Streptomyces sp. NPDC090053]|uniref:serine/threonine-protein kinase n=1 Tax=Streptomyces sp. NPDC090053 TaxID=3365932 RepID=UPI00381593FF
MDRGELIAGRYELLRRLGRGGMGEVWAARDRTLHRDIALKLLDLDGAGHPELPQRFEREAVAAAQINHPNVVALYDRGIHEDMLFLVMEKVEGATLTEHIHAESPISLARALAIASGICTALVAAHQAHVIHYDIKPHNVMLTADEQVKVVDFGIAGFVQATFSVARSSQLTPAGTVEYGAPEQFLTERGDERSDLYALGGVLFAMLARRPPFAGHNAAAIMRRKLDEEAPHLDSLCPDLPPAVTALVVELLQRDPDRRPQTARQVRERLQQLQAALASTNDGTSDLPTTKVQPPHVRPMDSTQQLAGPGGPFTISWTGKEPLSAYTTWLRHGVIVRLTIVMAVCAAVCFVSLALGPDEFFVREHRHNGWVITFLVSSGPGAWLLVMLSVAGVAASFRRLNYVRPAWSLQVGRPGIRTTSGSETREYQWSQVQKFAIEEMVGDEHQATAGLHIRFIKGTKHSTRPRLPGWPFPQRPSTRNGMVPICALGPMTDQQRAQLSESLARYGHGKNDTEAWDE